MGGNPTAMPRPHRTTDSGFSQEVLHLLRGASQEVTLLLCRPPPGALPEVDQGWQVSCGALWCLQAPPPLFLSGGS